eukprot:scaffold5578_cov157-Skeletonema_marinoi.AAC.11
MSGSKSSSSLSSRARAANTNSNKLLSLSRVATLVFAALTLTSYTTTAQTPPPSLCSCSPTKFNFKLNFQGTCESTSLTGVNDELCFINVGPGMESVAENVDFEIENILSMMSANQRALNSVIPTVVTSVDIFEYDTTNELTVINQEIFSNKSLSDGDIIEFTSISSKLDPNKPLQEQLEYFPGGLILRYTGVNSNNEDVINTFAWGYNIENCTTEQISSGDFIGWTIVDDSSKHSARSKAAKVPSASKATKASYSLIYL